jgi:hypothetical protein
LQENEGYHLFKTQNQLSKPMKKAIIISALLLCSTLAAMSQNVDEKLSSIQGKWVLDDKKM